MIRIVAAALLLASTAPAFAQDVPKPLTVSGSVGLISDYRFRGVSQSDREMAVQGGITVTHASGFYGGTWASNLAGWGPVRRREHGARSDRRLQGQIGRRRAIDVGLTWYMYPGGSDETDFAEPYVKLSGAAGPLNLLAGVAYAPKQQALGQWYFSGASTSGASRTGRAPRTTISTFGVTPMPAVPGTGFTVKGHIGYSDGNPGLGPTARASRRPANIGIGWRASIMCWAR